MINKIIPYNDGLRDYQIKSKEDIYDKWGRGVKSLMLQMPTGTGKTKVFSSIVRDFLKYFISNSINHIEEKILIIAHRTELIDQIASSIKHNKIDNFGFIDSNSNHKDQTSSFYTIQIANNQSLRDIQITSGEFGNSKVRIKAKNVKLIIIDEAHHALADTYQNIIKLCPDAHVLGVTATPYRLNGASFTDIFNEIILSENHDYFVKRGYLKPIKFYSYSPFSKYDIDNIEKSAGDYNVDDLYTKYGTSSEVLADLINAYNSHVSGKKGIVFCINIKHCEEVTARYKANGVTAEIISSDTSKSDRDRIVSEFREGIISVLCNVDIFSEGFDCPDIDFVQIARPTLSVAKYLQMVGRATRFVPNKIGYVLDNAGLYETFGSFKQDWDWTGWFNGDYLNNNYNFDKNLEANVYEIENENEEIIESDIFLEEVESDDIPIFEDQITVDFLSLEYFHFLPKKYADYYFEMKKWVLDDFYEKYPNIDIETYYPTIIIKLNDSVSDLFDETKLAASKFLDYTIIRNYYYATEKELNEIEVQLIQMESIETTDVFNLEEDQLQLIFDSEVLKFINAFKTLQTLEDAGFMDKDSFYQKLVEKYPNQIIAANNYWNGQNNDIDKFKEKRIDFEEKLEGYRKDLISIYENCQFIISNNLFIKVENLEKYILYDALNMYLNLNEKNLKQDQIIFLNEFDFVTYFSKSKYKDYKIFSLQEISEICNTVLEQTAQLSTISYEGNLIEDDEYKKEIYPGDLTEVYNIFIKTELPCVLHHLKSLYYSKPEAKEDDLNIVENMATQLEGSYNNKSKSFKNNFKNFIIYIQNQMRGYGNYKFQLRPEQLDLILKTGMVSNYDLRIKVIKQIFHDFNLEILSITQVYSNFKKYIPHFRIATEDVFLNWIRTQPNYFEVLQDKKITLKK